MWDVALGAAIHVYNRTPHAGIKFDYPIRKIFPDINLRLNHIRRFGSLMFVKRLEKVSKVEPKGIYGVLVGYTSTGYKVMLPKSKKIIRIKHARPRETKTYKHLTGLPTDDLEPEIDEKLWLKEFDSIYRRDDQGNRLPIGKKEVSDKKTEGESENEQDSDNQILPTPSTSATLPTPKKRGRPRKIKPNEKQDKPTEDETALLADESIPIDTNAVNIKQHFENELQRLKTYLALTAPIDDLEAFALIAGLAGDPTTVDEALASTEKEFWEKAIF